ncbi:MAG: energy transducer TonB [Terracidiphilus sp.]
MAASDIKGVQQLLDSAHQPADLFHNSREPFLLEIDFTAQLTHPVEGRFLLKWKAKDQWWSKVVFGGYQQITMQNGEMLYTARNLDFTPLAIENLFKLIHFTDDSVALTAKKEKDRVEAGVSLACINAERVDSINDQREFCVDSATHNLLSETSKGALQEKRQQQFEDYLDFEGSHYPAKLYLLYSGHKVISATVLRLQSAAFDPALLAPPKGAIERRHCPGMKWPVAIQTPKPTFDYHRYGFAGESNVALTVLPDGSVGDARLLSDGGPIMDGPTLSALKKWKFKPAMCGDEPVVADIVIELAFEVH